MVRQLPWTATSRAPSSSQRLPPPKQAKRQPSNSPSDDEDSSPKPTKRRAQSKLKLETTTPQKPRPSSRSPSTSPVLGPPTASPMRAGYDADDIYMMVEDELLAVAQTFTHHLHAAEYKRLKKKAREGPPPHSLLPTLSPNAPKEVKRKFDVMALQERQNGVLDGSEAEGEEKRDPWVGSTLAGLMANVGSQPRRALPGSQEMESHTKAARGYGRGGEGESPMKKKKMTMPDVDSGSPPQPLKSMAGKTTSDRSSSPDRNNNIAREATTARQSNSNIRTPYSTAASAASVAAISSTKTTKSTTAAGQTRRKKALAFDDDFDMNALLGPMPSHDDDVPVVKPSPAGKRKVKKDEALMKKEKEKDEKKGKTKLNDIPMFLV